jgi:hypothetical protein
MTMNYNDYLIGIKVMPVLYDNYCDKFNNDYNQSHLAKYSF